MFKNQPIRCFDGQARPHEPFWRLRNAAETGGEPEIEFYGFISEYSWFEDDITPKIFKDDLYRLGNGGPVTVRINSGGGDVVAASVIRAIMLDYPGHITTRVDGMAASAAMHVALAGKTVQMQDTAYMMIHDPSFTVFLASLDIDMLAGMLDTLKTVKSGIMDAYQSRTGISRERLSKMMSDETWITAKEAVSLGFADHVISGKSAASAISNAVLAHFVNVPAALRGGPQPEPVIDQQAVDHLRAEVLLYV